MQRRAAQSRSPVPPHFMDGRRHAFTLLEALMASVILAMAVAATSMALSAGRQHSLEAQDAVQAALAAEALMAEILAAGYDGMTAYNGREELPGQMLESGGDPYPDTFARIGRRATVTEARHTIDPPGVVIDGLEVEVEAFLEGGRVVCELVRFIPEPTS